MTDPDQTLRDILSRTSTIALAGASPRPNRPSHGVGLYLVRAGFRVIPINPRHAGETLFGERVVAAPEDVEGEVDLLDVFRRSDAVPPLVEAALARWPRLPAVWLQIGVESAAAERMAQAHGVAFVQDRCIKIDHSRLFGAPATT